jgi:hypothetical protein
MKAKWAAALIMVVSFAPAAVALPVGSVGIEITVTDQEGYRTQLLPPATKAIDDRERTRVAQAWWTVAGGQTQAGNTEAAASTPSLAPRHGGGRDYRAHRHHVH